MRIVRAASCMVLLALLAGGSCDVTQADLTGGALTPAATPGSGSTSSPTGEPSSTDSGTGDSGDGTDGTGTSASGTDDGATSGTCEPLGAPGATVERQMLEAINQYRSENGLAELFYSSACEAAAEAHARDMYDRDFFEHTNPDGDTPFDRVEAAGFCEPRLVGENIAWGLGAVETAAEAQQGWEDSPAHDENMRNPDYLFVGMGHYQAPTGAHFWVQVFATPRQ